jgi:ankyrin repeat protein
LAPQLVNVAKSDGFTALHLAALNGNQLTAEVLIDVVSYQTVAHRKREQIILFLEQQVAYAAYVNFFV